MKKSNFLCYLTAAIMLLCSCSNELTTFTDLEQSLNSSTRLKVAPTGTISVSPVNMQTIKGWGVKVDQLTKPIPRQAELVDLGITIARLYMDHNHCNEDGSVNTTNMDLLCNDINILNQHTLPYILCSWSPNYKMKDIEGPTGEGQLRYDKESAFVDYWLNVCKYIHSKSLPLPTAIVIQNEPTLGRSVYDGMGFQDQEIGDFSQYYRVIKSVRQHLDSAGYNAVKLLGPEEGYASGEIWGNGLRYLGGNGFTAFNDAELRNAIWGVSGHSYYWETDTIGIRQWSNSCELWGKDKWMTEFCDAANKDPNASLFTYAIESARRFCSDMVYVRTNYWFWWAASQGPWREVLIDYTNYMKLPTYYLFQRIWKNVPVGSVVRRVTSNNPSLVTTDNVNMDGAAFVTPQNKTVLVLVNFTSSTMTESIDGLTGNIAHIYQSTATQNMEFIDSLNVSQGYISSITLPAKSISVIVTSTLPGINVLSNAGFENDAAQQVITDWNTWPGPNGTDANADYTEPVGHTGTYHLTHWKASAYEVSTSQTVSGLINGTYVLTAWIRGGGNQTLQMSAQKTGVINRNYTVPVTSSWTQYTIDNIDITSGQCKIDFWDRASANGWVHIDDIVLKKK